MTATTSADRMRALRERRAAEGRREVTISLSGAAYQKLVKIANTSGGTLSTAVESLLARKK